MNGRPRLFAWGLLGAMVTMSICGLIASGLLAVFETGQFQPDWGLSIAGLFIGAGVYGGVLYGERLRRYWGTKDAKRAEDDEQSKS